jgi:hypothetical protein
MNLKEVRGALIPSTISFFLELITLPRLLKNALVSLEGARTQCLLQYMTLMI